MLLSLSSVGQNVKIEVILALQRSGTLARCREGETRDRNPKRHYLLGFLNHLQKLDLVFTQTPV